MSKKARSRKYTAKQSVRLAAYGKIVVGAGMASTSSSSAAIVFFDVDPDITLTVYGNNFITFGNINLSTGTFDNSYSGWNTSLALNSSGWFTSGNLQFASSGGAYADFLSYGDVHFVPPIYNWNSGVNSLGGPWASGGSGYVGVILTQGLGIENWNFGWMALNYVAAGGASTLTVSGFAFESVPGTPIVAGQGASPAVVPEPGTWAAAALLAGGATFLRWRRRRDEAQKKAA